MLLSFSFCLYIVCRLIQKLQSLWQILLNIQIYLKTGQYLNHAEKSDMTLVEAFKRMQVMEHEELEDAAEENGEPDQLVSHVHSASYCPF